MYHIIVNPHSKSGKGLKAWKQIEQILINKKIDYQSYFTEYEEHAVAITKEITTNHRNCKLIVLGGDGTLNEVINGINDFDQVMLGYIPSGSSNDFAKGLNIPNKPDKALEKILHSNTTNKIDIGYLHYQNTTKRFIGSSGIGFDASVCYYSNQSNTKGFLNHLKLGKLIYLYIALRTLFSYQTTKMSLTIDKQQYHYSNCYFACLLNNKFEGGGFKFTPNAKLDDGLFDICIVQGIPKIVLVFLLPTAFLGLHTKVKGVHMLNGKNISIQSSLPSFIHIDGEVIDKQTSINIECKAKLLEIIL